MSDEAIVPAWKAVESTRAQRHHEAGWERDYIDVLSVRRIETDHLQALKLNAESQIDRMRCTH